jgi:hypothetical protein
VPRCRLTPTMQPLRPIDYFFAAVFGFTLGCLMAAFI